VSVRRRLHVVVAPIGADNVPPSAGKQFDGSTRFAQCVDHVSQVELWTSWILREARSERGREIAAVQRKLELGRSRHFVVRELALPGFRLCIMPERVQIQDETFLPPRINRLESNPAPHCL